MLTLINAPDKDKIVSWQKSKNFDMTETFVQLPAKKQNQDEKCTKSAKLQRAKTLY